MIKIYLAIIIIMTSACTSYDKKMTEETIVNTKETKHEVEYDDKGDVVKTTTTSTEVNSSSNINKKETVVVEESKNWFTIIKNKIQSFISSIVITACIIAFIYFGGIGFMKRLYIKLREQIKNK